MWIAKEVESKETSWRENFGFLESSAKCTVNGNGEKKSSELKDSGSSGMLQTEEVHRLEGKARKPKKFSKEKGEKSKGACYR